MGVFVLCFDFDKNMEEIEDIPNENLEVLSINNSLYSHVSEIVVNAL